MAKHNKSILVLVGGDHLFHGTNHRINLLVDFLKQNFKHVLVISPHHSVKPTQKLVDRINTRTLTYENLIFTEQLDENVKYYLIPPLLGYKAMPVLMKSYVPLLLKGQHFDMSYSHGVELADLPKILKE